MRWPPRSPSWLRESAVRYAVGSLRIVDWLSGTLMERWSMKSFVSESCWYAIYQVCLTSSGCSVKQLLIHWIWVDGVIVGWMILEHIISDMTRYTKWKGV